MNERQRVWLGFLVAFTVAWNPAVLQAEPYELSKNDVMDPKAVISTDISLFGVKLGDPESKAVDILVNEKIPGVVAEQEGTFILLRDQRKPTGPMAGVRVLDGKVDLIFINNRFAYKTRGIFRNVLNSESRRHSQVAWQGRLRRRKRDGRGSDLRKTRGFGELSWEGRQCRVHA